jgi:tetratricopeptide (TPR) repeat protein
VGLPLGFFVPRKAPLAYVLGGEVHGRLYSTPSGNVSRLWASTFPHEYCHVVFKRITGRQYFQYAWLQEGIGEYFRRLYLQEKVLAPDFDPGPDDNFLLEEQASESPAQDLLQLRDRTYGIMSYTDWEVRTALRYDKVPSVRELCPRTFVGYWQKYNTAEANQIYSISSSLVEFLVNEYGWRKLRELLAGLRENGDLDTVMKEVYGFDQDGLDEKWRLHLKKRWPDPWQPNISMVYLVRGNWEVDGHESGIRAAMAEQDLEAAHRHWKYYNSRSIPDSQEVAVAPFFHTAPIGATFPGDGFEEDGHTDSEGTKSLRNGRGQRPPAIEQYEAAMAAYSMGRFREGVNHLLNALEIEPEQLAPLRIHLARGFWLIGEQEKALSLYKDELLDNKDLPFVNEVAWCFERSGAYQSAIDLYRLIAESSQIPGLRDHARRRIDRLTVMSAQAGGPSEPDPLEDEL